LPGPLAVDPEKPLIDTELPIKGKALQPVGQDVGTGHHTGLTALSFYVEDRVATVGTNLSRGDTQGFRDPETRLEKGQDEQPVSHLVPPLAGLGHGLDLFIIAITAQVIFAYVHLNSRSN